MDPNLSSWMSSNADPHRRGGREREYVAWRSPHDRARSRPFHATRVTLSTLFLALGTRLADEPLPAAPGAKTEPATHTP